ncbi:MarR family winged helix-turn-helix transcriptional regulator [Jiella pelagia]|uniref:MarR family transcriptional regulator n=1 Tax=Jiella pelagia TaxID=2986949 RepID=A0ABY7C5E5_9HYPH|nr:MarR family transcriptional regulator [Jiella pelagia]WAP70249.1 MarR family transcriptional regulator [Jiella pelagia]
MPRAKAAPLPSSERKPEGFREFSNLFKQVVHVAVGLDRELATRYGLALTDLACLGFLEETAEPVSPKMIAEHVGLSTGATTALLDRLEREGFIERRPNPADRRGVIIALVSDKAAQVLDDQKDLRNRLQGAYEGLSPEEAAGATRFLLALLEEPVPCVGPDKER